ncbi:MAG: ribonuclease D [Alphaproteobacteria bacterium]|nr:ribonuclease D [Alphaproteobacteria bacterium]
MQVITETESLRSVSAAFRERSFVAVDTEFLRESTYWPKLCLIQAAADGVEAVIDPLAPGIDLTPFYEVLADKNVLKVFHAARQDLEIFFKAMGTMPAPVFDTQIGAMACGYGESIAYDALVAGELKRRIDKSHRFTDWSRRPLSPDQLAYALADVTHLRDLHPKLMGRLERTGRVAWVADELAGLVDPGIYDTEPENAWLRLKLRKTSGDYVLALQVAAAWRERTAQTKDVPRARVLKDDALYEIAEQRPRNAAAFDRLRAVPKGFGNSRGGQELAAALDAALSDPERKAPLVDRPAGAAPSAGPTIELLKVLLRTAAERHDVAARLIASSADIEAIAMSDDADVPALSGWRRDLFGEHALALKKGKLALSLENGKVSVKAI